MFARCPSGLLVAGSCFVLGLIAVMLWVDNIVPPAWMDEAPWCTALPCHLSGSPGEPRGCQRVKWAFNRSIRPLPGWFPFGLTAMQPGASPLLSRRRFWWFPTCRKACQSRRLPKQCCLAGHSPIASGPCCQCGCELGIPHQMPCFRLVFL